MSKRRKVILVCLLAALCLGAVIFLAVRSFGVAGTAKADSECVHAYVFTETVEPTCTLQGYDLYACEKCGAEDERNFTAALGHNWDDEEEGIIIPVEPTCTAAGITWHFCTRCWNSYQSDPVAATGHVWSGGGGTVHTATCTAVGYTEYVCEKCAYSCKTDETPMTEHSMTVTETVEKTCTEDGYTVRECLGCDKKEVEYDFATGHVYTEKTTASGCVSYGYTAHTCEVCGDSYVTDYVSPLGHVYELSEVVASGSSYGYTQLTCRVCGYVYITNIVTSGDDGYTHDYVLKIHEATCFEGGYWEYVCADCNQSFTCNQTAALVHEWSYEFREPTCTEDGGWVYFCPLCETTYCDELWKALGHDYEETVTAPTCLEGGFSTFVCRSCGDVYYGAYTAATGHSYGVRNAVVSTSQKTLTLSYVCGVCGSSAVSRLEVVFTDAEGSLYAFYFDPSGTADFSSLPEGNYTASVVDTYLGTVVSMFTIEASAPSGTSDGENPSDAGDMGAEHVHVFTASVSINPSERTLTVSYGCSCGYDLTDGVYVTFRGGDGAYTFYPASGKTDYSAVPAGSYTVYVFYEDEEVTSFTLSVADDPASAVPDGDSEGDADGDTYSEDPDGDVPEDGETPDDNEGEDRDDDSAVLTGDAGGGGDSFADGDLSQSAAEDDGGGNGAATVIILLVVFVVVVGVIVAVWIVWRRRSKKKKEEADASSEADNAEEEDE